MQPGDKLIDGPLALYLRDLVVREQMLPTAVDMRAFDRLAGQYSEGAVSAQLADGGTLVATIRQEASARAFERYEPKLPRRRWVTGTSYVLDPREEVMAMRTNLVVLTAGFAEKRSPLPMSVNVQRLETLIERIDGSLPKDWRPIDAVPELSTPPPNPVAVDYYVDCTRAEAEARATEAGLEVVTIGDGEVVARQEPPVTFWVQPPAKLRLWLGQPRTSGSA